jgi:tetratricopeptide (TPR) repeat protein
VKSRRKITIDVDINDSIYSDLIKKVISNTNNYFLNITNSLAFSSELHFSLGINIYKKQLKKLYLDFFENIFKTTLRKYLAPLIKNDADKMKVEQIIKSFNINRYSTLIGLLGEFLKENKHKKEANCFRSLLYEGIVKYAYNDNEELHNFGVVCFEMGNTELAVKVAESIVESNPTETKYYYFLLSIYLTDRIYSNRFEKIKKYVLENFRLNEKSKKAFEILLYN